MLGSRRGRPSVLGRAAGTAARTAVITKTATSVAGRSAAKQQQQLHARELAHAQTLAATAPAATPAPAQTVPVETAPATGELHAFLQTLAQAHGAGILNDAEFVAKVKERLG